MLVASERETWEGWAFGEGRERRIPTVYSSEFNLVSILKQNMFESILNNTVF